MILENSNEYKTVCPYCGVGCGVVLKTDGSRVTGLEGDVDHPSNKGKLCSKGLNLHNTIHKKDRITHPLIRDSRKSPFISTSWDDALDTIAAKFQSLIATDGPESIAFYVSGQLLTEDYYVVNKLSKGFLKVNNLDSNSRLCMSSAVMGYRRAFGVDAPPCSYEDLEHTDCVFITGSNMAYCHPIVFMQLSEQKKKRGDDLKIIVADPRRTSTAGIADIYLPVSPGTDVALLNSMAHVMIENDLVDHDYINAYTDGYDALKETIKEYSPEKVSSLCGISADLIREAAMTFGKSKAAMTFWAMGLNQSSSGTNNNNALLNLSIITGNIGKPGAGPFSLTGQANAMGGRETGGLANILPGHRYMANESHRKQVASVWGTDELSEEKGLSAIEIYDEIEKGKIKAVWIICTNPVVSLPNGSKIEEALKKAELVIVQELYHPTDTSIYADIILPAAGFSEKEGTMTNQERRMSYIPKAINPPGEALPDWHIFTKFAHKMGFQDNFAYEKAEDIFEEYKTLNVGQDLDISGVTYERLKNSGTVQWPCPDSEHPGTPRLYTDGIFHTDNKKAQIISVDYNPPKETVDTDYPLIFTTGRIRDQWHTMTKTGKVPSLMMTDPEPVLEIHPQDAEIYELKDGDLTLVESRRGKATLKCIVTEKIKKGTVFLPFHWGSLLAGSGRANLLTNEVFDPISQQPEFKVCAVKVRKMEFTDKSKILILGDDPSSIDLAKNVVETNPNADITLFSSTQNTVNSGIKIDRRITVSIDTENKTVEFEDTSYKEYDKLILSPEKKHFVPPVKGLYHDGIKVIDSYTDARRIIAKEHTLGKVVVIGTSPYSVEIVDLLISRGANKIHLVSHKNILLDKYMDSIGSQLLFKKMTQKGIKIVLGAEIDEITHNDNINTVRLGGGKEIQADIVFIESIKKPNLDLAIKSGVLVNRGIVVGEKLETNIPDIYALGKTSEIKGVLTSDSELLSQQAEVLAQHLCGDPTVRYTESLDANRFNILGLRIISFGQFNADYDKSNMLTFIDKAYSIYKKIVIRDNKIVGGLFIGDLTGSEEVLNLARNKSDISKYRNSLLSGYFKEMLPTGKIVCSCMSVTKHEIIQSINNGTNSVEALQQELKVAVTCGSCFQEVKEIFTKITNPH